MLVVAAGLGGLVIVAGMPAVGEGPVSGAVLITRASLACGVGLATVVPLQFLRRCTGLARGITAGAALAVALIVQAWPWSAAQVQRSIAEICAETGWGFEFAKTRLFRARRKLCRMLATTSEFDGALRGLSAATVPMWKGKAA